MEGSLYPPCGYPARRCIPVASEIPSAAVYVAAWAWTGVHRISGVLPLILGLEYSAVRGFLAGQMYLSGILCWSRRLSTNQLCFEEAMRSYSDAVVGGFGSRSEARARRHMCLSLLRPLLTRPPSPPGSVGRHRTP